MTTPARELRDALAEALWRADLSPRYPTIGWDRVIQVSKDDWYADADRLLASLPRARRSTRSAGQSWQAE